MEYAINCIENNNSIFLLSNFNFNLKLLFRAQRLKACQSQLKAIMYTGNNQNDLEEISILEECLNMQEILFLLDSMSTAAREDLVFRSAAIYDCIKNVENFFQKGKRPEKESRRAEIAALYLKHYCEPLLQDDYQNYYNLIQSQSLDIDPNEKA